MKNIVIHEKLDNDKKKAMKGYISKRLNILSID